MPVIYLPSHVCYYSLQDLQTALLLKILVSFTVTDWSVLLKTDTVTNYHERTNKNYHLNRPTDTVSIALYVNVSKAGFSNKISTDSRQVRWYLSCVTLSCVVWVKRKYFIQIGEGGPFPDTS
jgi:GTP1/Obg family GTP-binding protein